VTSPGRHAPPPALAEHRIGRPSPLLFHLAAALAAYQQAMLAAPNAGDARFPWAPHLREAAARIGPLDRLAVAREAGRRLAAMIAGIEAWQRHPYRRTVVEPPTIWRRGSTRLLDYGQAPEATARGGRPILFVPSLINEAYILDLMPEASLLRFLAAAGLRPVLLDWGRPGTAESGFDIDTYGRDRLLPAARHLAEEAGGPIGLVGYCMGGTIAAGLAARRPDLVACLATIGAPWDFAAGSGLAGGLRAALRAGGASRVEAQIRAAGDAFGAVPDCVFQLLFALVNPIQAALKFQRFARLDPGSAAARRFVAVEDWLADGRPMATGAARDLLVDWQIRNDTMAGRWVFLGGPVRPRAIRAPLLAFCGQSDTIAPEPIARALPAGVAGARIARPPTGHVGMIVGGVALGRVWAPLADFLHGHGRHHGG
jgi:polyhydroxyalkanoate synthase